jgi:CHAD domain-containing protein
MSWRVGQNDRMAKAHDVPGLTAELRFGEAAAAIVGVRAEEVFEHADAVLDVGDIERVHDMRVATRRLRAMLEIFEPCFPAASLKPVLGEVKALADALGERRDPDVQLAALAAFEAGVLKADAPGVEVVAARERERQAAGNVVLADALRAAEETDLRGRLQALAAEAGA